MFGDKTKTKQERSLGKQCGLFQVMLQSLHSALTRDEPYVLKFLRRLAKYKKNQGGKAIWSWGSFYGDTLDLKDFMWARRGKRWFNFRILNFISSTRTEGACYYASVWHSAWVWATFLVLWGSLTEGWLACSCLLHPCVWKHAYISCL